MSGVIGPLWHYLVGLNEPFHSRRALLRALWHAVVRGHDGEICRRCGRPVAVVWLTTDQRWEEITGRQSQAEGGLRCVNCFDVEARERGVLLRWTPGELA